MIYLLAGAAVLSFLIGHRVDAAVIAGVVVLNTLLGFFQEWRAEGALNALRTMAAHHARVLRNGKPLEIEASGVVPGDMLVLETGDWVAADARILGSEPLRTDESALTGESQPVEKQTEKVAEDTPMADRHDMAWMSTNVTGGRGRALVVETGMRTAMGKIAGEVRATVRESTPLQKRMHKLGIVLGIGGVVLAAGGFGLGLLRGHEWVEMLMFAVAVAVSAIPEGLPAVISVTLALGVRRMAQRNVIVRRMSAVETLGSTTVICSDKTGTITENQMTVRWLWAGGQAFKVSGDGYPPEGELRQEGGEAVGERPAALERLLRIGALSNNADLKQEDGQWQVEGNPSEGALLAVAIKADMEIGPMRGEGQRLAEIPFSSDAKYMATLHPDQDGAGRVAFVKGAPERILEFCTHLLRDGESVELNEDLRREIGEISERYASEALLMPIMAAGTLGLFWVARQNGELDYARTVAFTAMAAFQWFQAFNARSNYQSIFSIGVFSNRSLLLGVGAAVLLQLAAVHTSVGHRLLGTTGLSWMDWLLIVLVSSAIWGADEILKRLGAYGKPQRSLGTHLPQISWRSRAVRISRVILWATGKNSQ